MSLDPYTPPETDVQVEETLPARPVLGISLAFLLSFIGGIVVSTLFALAISQLFNPDAVAANENVDPGARLRMVTNLYFVQMFIGLIIAFLAGFICVRVSRSIRWRYLFILIALSATPTLLTMLAVDEMRSPFVMGGAILQFVAILIGGRIAMIKLNKDPALRRL